MTHTKGKWEVDKSGNNVVNENVHGILATAWSTYNSEEIEERLEGESWLSMRERTEYIRKEKELETKSNAKLIASAPEMKLALEKIIEMNYKTAEDQYGDKSKADSWSCVIVAKEALKKAIE